MTRSMTRVVVLVIVFLLAISVNAHEGHNDAFSQETVDTTKVQKIELTKEGEEAIGIEVASVKLSKLRKYVQATGRVAASDNQYSDISVPITGSVVKVLAKEGDRVTRGQTLALVKSIEATNLLKDLLNEQIGLEKEIAILAKQLELNKANYEREETLLAEGITSKQEFLAAEAAYENTKTALSATQRQLSITSSTARSQLGAMGIGAGTVNQSIDSGLVSASVAITAPITGVVSFRDISPGSTIQSDKKIFSIVNLDQVWVEVDIYQNEVSNIKVGSQVNITTSSNEDIKGTIANIGSVLDPMKRTVTARVVCDNPNHTLKPGMAVTAKIIYGEGEEDVALIPTSAIVEDQGESVVYVKYDTYYQPVVVKIGLKDASEIEVIDGLYEGDLVVVRGAEQLHSQALLGAKEAESKKAEASEMLPWKFLLSVILTALVTSLIWFLVLRFKSKRGF